MARWHRSGDDAAPAGPTPEQPTEGWAGGATDDTAPVPPPLPGPQGPSAPPIAPGPPPPPGPAAPPPIAPWTPPPGAYALTPAGATGLQYGRTVDRVMAYVLDGLIIGIPTAVTAAFISRIAVGGSLRLGGVSLVATIITVGVDLLYFVAFWTGGDGATPGMRVMKLRMGDARTGETLTVQQGLVRWLALGGALQLLAVFPPITAFAGLLEVVWVVILLATTATSPTKQGLHDRFADSALVQPQNAQTPAVTCLVILIALLAISVIGTVALVFLGGQVSMILSNVGDSI